MVARMSSVLILTVLATLQTSSQAQQSTASDLTRMLNGAPPAATRPLPSSAETPVVSVPPLSDAVPRTVTAPSPLMSAPNARPVGPSSASAPPRSQPLAPSGTGGTASNAAGGSAPGAPDTVAPPRVEPPPAGVASAATQPPRTPAANPAPSTVLPPSSTGTVASEAVVAAEPVEPPPPPVTVLTPAAISALPFSLDLPSGVTMTTGRPGPNFTVWTVRRGERSLVMIYAGPTSQFPIYSGEMIEAGGRTSIVATEERGRVALEHLFTRTTAPREIHAWITSVEGEDRLLAEQIAQSIDPR